MKKRIFPLYGRIGLVLIIIFWFINWYLPGLRTHLAFFPLWVGYSLFIDGLVHSRKGSSLIKRSLKKYILLYIISIPVWWIFESFNLVTKNWSYSGVENFTDLEYFLLASLNFSTVIPAVFGTAELVSTINIRKRIRKNFGISRYIGVGFAFLGLVLFAFIILRPKIFYPFIWVVLYLLFESVNMDLGNRTLLYHTRRASWRPIISLTFGALICGFFWEMWNYYSYPKWTYNLPYVNFLYIFEMPILGYLGYPFFAFELFAIYHFITGFSKNKNFNYLELSSRRSIRNSY